MAENPKSEIRNPKQFLNQERAMSQTMLTGQLPVFGLLISNLFRISDFGFRILILLLLFVSTVAANAQPNPQTTQDPLMNLMLAQPQIDVDSPVTPASAFDPPVVRPGQSATYSVKLNALEASVEWPDHISAPNLQLRQGGHGQILALGGGKLQPHTTFNYHVTAAQTGQFTIPAFTVEVYGNPVEIPAAQLSVVSNPDSATAAPALVFEAATTNLYVGQPVRLRVVLPGSPSAGIQALGQVQINGQGFIVDQSSVRQQLGAIPRPQGGGPVVGFIYDITLTPVATGTLSAFAQGFAGNRFGGGIVIPNGPASPTDFILLDSDPIELRVKPLPHDGQLPGFTGGFAPLSIESPSLSTNVFRVGDPVKLTVKVYGDPNNNLQRLVPPAPPQDPDWQLFLINDTAPPPLIQAQGYIAFSYNLIALSTRPRATPAIPFSCFDPDRAAYQDITITPVPVQILPGSVPTDLRAIEKADAADASREKEPTLSGLAASCGLSAWSLVPVQRLPWFALAQLLPAAAFTGLWGWDRRRRYLEQHPDVVLRRRARRALRRHWRALRSAARRRDSARFAASAIEALQAASAPHYPATPHALVGADVIALLPPDQRVGRSGDVVRRFFSACDAARFGPVAAGRDELLALEPELEEILAQFEARLAVPGYAAESHLAAP